MLEYKKYATLKLRKANISRASELVKSAYIKEQAEEKTARYTSRLELASRYDLKKTYAFAASAYADNRLPREMDHLLAVDEGNRQEEVGAIVYERTRRKFINDRIAEHGPVGFGSRGYTPQEILEGAQMEEKVFLKSIGSTKQDQERRLVGNISKFVPLPDELTLLSGGGILKKKEESKRAKGMRKLFEKELSDIMETTVNRIMHDFKKPDGGHISRLRAHNAARKGTTLLEFKFPKDVNEKPMDWLNENIDEAIIHIDKKTRNVSIAKAQASPTTRRSMVSIKPLKNEEEFDDGRF
jgi:hypothetical protein